MRSSPKSSFDFPAYLEAKYQLDSTSLNSKVYAQFQDHLRPIQGSRILDLGTGTGAMLRRIIELSPAGKVELIGLDQEERNLAIGLERIEETLKREGFAIAELRRSGEVKSIRGRKNRIDARVDLLRGDITDSNTARALGSFDVVTAHAFMDLMPLKRIVAIIRSLLNAGGVFYSTLNYDGLTVLLPEYTRTTIERRLLRTYDRSMENRRARGLKTGGARSGTRLYRALVNGGFSVIGLGSSDWNVVPPAGGYSDEDKHFLAAIISMIEGEARRAIAQNNERNTVVDPTSLSEWLADRLDAVENSRLSMIVHQIDLLAKSI